MAPTDSQPDNTPPSPDKASSTRRIRLLAAAAVIATFVLGVIVGRLLDGRETTPAPPGETLADLWCGVVLGPVFAEVTDTAGYELHAVQVVDEPPCVVYDVHVGAEDEHEFLRVDDLSFTDSAEQAFDGFATSYPPPDELDLRVGEGLVRGDEAIVLFRCRSATFGYYFRIAATVVDPAYTPSEALTEIVQAVDDQARTDDLPFQFLHLLPLGDCLNTDDA